MIVTSTHVGTSNFIVRMVGQGNTEYLVNEIGRYNGQALYADVRRGRHRIVVEADGAWTIKLGQPLASAPGARLMPGTITGSGARVIRLRTSRNLQPVVTGTHNGESNFIVQMVGYGQTSGTEYLFNEIGRYRGQTLIEDMPRGTYLLAVGADGGWTIRMTP